MRERIEHLYTLPLAEFIAARNQLAGELSDAAAAAEVRALAKPNVVAWAVNQVYHRARDRFDALVIAAGEVLRAQAAGEAEPLRESMRVRRGLLDDAVAFARDTLESAGHGVNPATLQKVTRCLDALATWGDADGAPLAGRLSREVEPPGLEVLAARADRARPHLTLVPPAAAAAADAAPKPRAAPAPAPDSKARAAFAEAEAAFEVRTREADRAREARDRAVARADELAAKVDEAAARLAELETRLAAAQREAREAKSALRRADAAETRARDRLARAREDLG